MHTHDLKVSLASLQYYYCADGATRRSKKIFRRKGSKEKIFSFSFEKDLIKIHGLLLRLLLL